MSAPSIDPFLVAAVQAEPVWLDAQRTVDKTISLLKEAAGKGAKLVAFPELWIPGYPYFLWVKDFGAAMPMTTKYVANALTLDSEEIRQIQQGCKDLGVWISFGYAEKRQNSLYMSNCIIDDKVN
ncbi:hypothetical protein CBS101457_003116 [Exobasidium rhododendri]|nr:hypothetical protein CBS101457_003116 [Exobasidium rhododendri]